MTSGLSPSGLIPDESMFSTTAVNPLILKYPTDEAGNIVRACRITPVKLYKSFGGRVPMWVVELLCIINKGPRDTKQRLFVKFFSGFSNCGEVVPRNVTPLVDTAVIRYRNNVAQFMQRAPTPNTIRFLYRPPSGGWGSQDFEMSFDSAYDLFVFINIVTGLYDITPEQHAVLKSRLS